MGKKIKVMHHQKSLSTIISVIIGGFKMEMIFIDEKYHL